MLYTFTKKALTMHYKRYDFLFIKYLKEGLLSPRNIIRVCMDVPLFTKFYTLVIEL